jgi:hypothetical protein
VDLVRTDVSEEPVASIFRVGRNRELGTMLAVMSRQQHTQCFFTVWFSLLVTADISSSRFLSTLKMEATRSTEMSVLTRPTWCHIPEDDILHSHCRENVTSYVERKLSKFALNCLCFRTMKQNQMVQFFFPVQQHWLFLV